MGQYYKAVNLSKKEWVQGEWGVKLMEFSWMGNKFMGTVMSLMLPGGDWHKCQIAFVGDYYGGPDAPEDNDEEWYRVATKWKEASETPMTEEQQRSSYLVNHTHKVYIDLSKLPDEGNIGTIHPLSLLTALGNGRGGGDFHGDDMDSVGAWAKDILSIEMAAPKGYTEQSVYFSEK